MILAAALLMIAQEVPAPAPAAEDNAEIVVRATYGRTTMLFDRGADGKLRNCRIMVSSGSQKRDTNACQATPVCYEKTADEVTDCVELIDLGPVEPAAKPAVTAAPKPFEILQLAQPAAPSALVPGPRIVAEEARDADRQRVRKLPPPPTAPHGEPVIHVTSGSTEQEKQP